MANIKEPRDGRAIRPAATRVIHIVKFLDPQYNKIILITVGLWLEL